MTEHADLQLLGAAVELTSTRINVDAAEAWERVQGRPPSGPDWLEMRRSILRLEREGLVQSDAELRIEPTADGRRVVSPLSSE